MPANQGYEYFNAEKRYYSAKTPEDKMEALEEMIRNLKKHKGSENMLAELKTRLKKLREKEEKSKKTGRGRTGIRKEGYQVVFTGPTNSGKSALLGALTNAKPLVSLHPYTTSEPVLGTMDYEGVKAQIIDQPSMGHASFDIGLTNNADCIVIVVDNLNDITKVEKILKRVTGKIIIVFNKIDLLSGEDKRKLEERCKAKRINAFFVSAFSGEGIDELKKKIFESMVVIRIYMKEPGKKVSNIPAVLPVGSTLKDAAESIFHGFSNRVREARVTGPSAKFANQKVGLGHVLRDKDIVEFKV